MKLEESTPHLLVDFHEFKVRFNETDPLGIVWHGHYITYLEDGRESFGEKFSGLTYQNILEAGVYAPIVKCSCEYKKPLKFGDIGVVETKFINSPAAKMTFQYIIKNTSNEIIATAETTQVFTDINGELLLLNPEFFEKWKKKWEQI